MADDLTAALFTGRELFGRGVARFVGDARPDVVAAYGLGDLAALVAAGALDHADALRLAVLREQLIAHACAHAGGGMLAIATPDAALVAAHVAERSGTQVARLDSPRHSVVAGSHAQLARARATAASLDVDIADLDAPAALHCSAMSATAGVFASVLAGVPFREPSMPVYSSVTAERMRDPRTELAACLHQPVLWTSTVRALDAAGVVRFVESGPYGLSDLVCETLGEELVHA